MNSICQSFSSREVPDASIILNILPLDERTIINQYFADEITNLSDKEVIIAA